MTSASDLNINKETSTNEEGKTTIEETKEKSPTKINTKNEEETAVVISSGEANVSKEDKQKNIEKTENDDEREKHDASSKSESEMKENELDAPPLFEQPIILNGKRSRKPTLRLEISESIPTKKELPIPQTRMSFAYPEQLSGRSLVATKILHGNGKPLGEIEYINYQITHGSTDALSRMRSICFGRRGNKANIRKNLREFKGFEFQRNSDEYQKHLNNLIKLKKDQLKSISNILGLPATGRNTDHAERILNFLMEPIDEGKRIPGKKSTIRSMKKRSTNSKESIDDDQETKNEKIENSKSQHDLDYVYKPGKKSSNKRASNHQMPTNTKRKKSASAISESKENQATNNVANEHKNKGEEIVKCQSTFCLKCRYQWHPHQHCSDLLTPNAMEIESNIKRCPRCRFPLEWTAGCAQIMCINCNHMFCWYCLKSLDNDFFLLHYERGPCRNRLGHSRASLFLHRLIIISLFIVFIILFIISAPLLILIAPFLICYRYKQMKNYFNYLTEWRQNFRQQNTSTIDRSLSSVNIEQQPITPSLPSLNINKCNNSDPMYDISSV
ncbi:unnamed protein product [Rotaria sp. Silwood1]|nr:unnamed protein product [Rotaria sp. Silwood1]CAF1194926.1 unnamed protein product [Rotaria sp. Silwood1]